MALQDKLIDSLGSFATKFNSYRYIMAIKSAFITLMPVIIVGAFSVLISNMVLDPKNGLASFQALSFLAALKPITSAINYATLNFLNIGAVFLIGIELGRINGIKSLFPGLLAVICFICVTPTTVEMMVDGQMHEVKDVLLRQFSDTRSLFLGMFIAILSVEIYCWLEGRKGLKIKMPDTVPPNVSASFSALIPAIITTTVIATFGFIFHQATGMYLYDAVYQVVQQPLERVVQSLPGILLLMFVAQLF
ncbi:MAG: PTS transporter subunit EIIC, partial [Klebsiella michiganensis]|nr:PTS transporter subunit EIIC [Klebsiella michiganensis]